MSGYYDKDGTPISDVMTWGLKLQDPEYKRVAKDTLDDGRMVSTVWLGLDHGWGDGPPLIFETMVFSSKDSFDDQYMERYATEAEALAGHQRIVQCLRTGQPLNEDN